MWLTAALLEELTSFFWLFQPHSQESKETILLLLSQQFEDMTSTIHGPTYDLWIIETALSNQRLQGSYDLMVLP
jgi:hypothetical protein